ncbi:hypothetical protein [Pseudomonas nitroreducens]|uniref:hypothetical protein n=1 Tax=Pseudomonas nitroreducens TaxID=46680 RepID=UPI0020A17892|nr:hypothetical protein [Pseudomonas nitroreducens]MCP1624849.1 hypothetical protein [Pseudomonas nitroreducens]
MAKEKSLFSPKIDFLMIGGLSIFCYPLFVLFRGQLNSADVAWWALVLAFFINGPHFLVSYQIFYISKFKLLFSDISALFVGVIVPVLLIVLLIFGFVVFSKAVFVYLLYAMIFLVGWHYVKQAYGCFVVYSGGQGVRFSSLELKAIKYSLFPLWWASYSFFFATVGDGDYWGLKYQSPIDFDLQLISEVLSLGSASLMLVILLRRRILRLPLPGVVALTPLAAIYLWLAPVFNDASFLYLVPLFHSLQYLLFSGAYTRGRARDTGKEKKGLLHWWGFAFCAAAIYFYLLPNWLDSARGPGEISPALFMVAFLLFVNIHHYFLDSVIWRGANAEVRKYVVMS